MKKYVEKVIDMTYGSWNEALVAYLLILFIGVPGLILFGLLANMRKLMIFGLFVFNFLFVLYGVEDNVTLTEATRDLVSLVIVSLALVMVEFDTLHDKLDKMKEDKEKK